MGLVVFVVERYKLAQCTYDLYTKYALLVLLMYTSYGFATAQGLTTSKSLERLKPPKRSLRSDSAKLMVLFDGLAQALVLFPVLLLALSVTSS